MKNKTLKLTIEEIEAFFHYLSNISRITSNSLLSVLETAYTVGKEDLELSIKVIDKLQKQKEMLENE